MPKARTKKASTPRAGSAIEAIQPSHWNKPRLQSLVRGFRNGERARRVLVIGDVGMDRYTIGVVERISPEAPVPIVLVQSEQFKLGLAANVADNVQALGGIPLLVGLVGHDRTAIDFRRLLRGGAINPSYLVTDPSRRTVLKDRVVSERQQLLRVDFESQHVVSRDVEEAVLRRIRELLPHCDAVILEDYAKGLVTERMARAIFAAARKERKFVAVDPNSKTPLRTYRGAFVLTPNTKEAEALSQIQIRDEKSLIEAGRLLLRESAAKHVVITRGKEGMAIFSSGSPKVRLIPTYAREVYDVSGAGDTVISVLTLALALGGSIEEASVLGNLAAGVEVGKRGTATVSPDEIQVALEFFGSMAV